MRVLAALQVAQDHNIALVNGWRKQLGLDVLLQHLMADRAMDCTVPGIPITEATEYVRTKKVESPAKLIRAKKSFGG